MLLLTLSPKNHRVAVNQYRIEFIEELPDGQTRIVSNGREFLVVETLNEILSMVNADA